MYDVQDHNFFFYSNETPPAVGAPDSGPWRLKITAAAGAPTVVAHDGFMELAMDNTNEVQNLCLYFGDELAFDIDNLLLVDFWCKATASLAATVSMAFGVTTARNDAIDTIAEQALFRILGDASTNPAFCETDDGTNNNDDKAAGQCLVATTKRFTIDFASGIKSVSPPSSSLGGKGQVLFSMDDVRGNAIPVCRSTAFDMSNYAAGLQLFAQVQKTSSTDVGTLSIQRVRVRTRLP